MAPHVPLYRRLQLLTILLLLVSQRILEPSTSGSAAGFPVHAGAGEEAQQDDCCEKSSQLQMQAAGKVPQGDRSGPAPTSRLVPPKVMVTDQQKKPSCIGRRPATPTMGRELNRQAALNSNRKAGAAEVGKPRRSLRVDDGADAARTGMSVGLLSPSTPSTPGNVASPL